MSKLIHKRAVISWPCLLIRAVGDRRLPSSRRERDRYLPNDMRIAAALAPSLWLWPRLLPPIRHGERGRLSTLIDRNLRFGGSWFTPAERAVIERKCGYAPGEWDGFEANFSNGSFTCRNGRELRAVLDAAEPRIRARVEAVMARADVVAAIGRVAEEAAAKALGEVEARRRR